MDLKQLSDTELRQLETKVEFDISKYHNFQLAKKIQLNSAYGAMGNQYFRFFDIRLAEAVTLSGQLVIQWIAKDVNLYLNTLLKTKDSDYVVAIDTDSVYISLVSVMEKIAKDKDVSIAVDLMDKFCEKKLQQVINKSCNSLAKYLNSYQQKMIMKREALADKALWTAKKRYALNVYDLEGVRYTEPSLKIMGIEAVKSSYPEICRDTIKETLKLIMSTDNESVINFIDKFRKEFHGMTPEEIGYSSSVSYLRKYEELDGSPKKGTPYNSKSSLLYNKLLKDNGLLKKYEEIKEGDKIKTIYLKEPNPISYNYIAFKNVLPKELGLEKFIDYDAQYDKVYLSPIKTILTAIGWETEHTNVLEFE